LGWIGHQLSKEGNALQALADAWLDKGDDKQIVFKEIGVSVCTMGEQLLAIRNQICQACAMQPVSIFMNFKSRRDEEK
jgi:hypothetical protein